MICPVCKRDMIVVERNSIEIDYCPDCSGTWFDSGEMELLLASVGVEDCRSFLADMTASQSTKTSEAARRCPVCSKKMGKANIGESPKVVIDTCVRGDGLWFDGGELSSLLTQIAEKPMVGPKCDQKIAAFLGDMFQAYQGPGNQQAGKK
jgi:Zn-finger nucleic acid-binding protein